MITVTIAQYALKYVGNSVSYREVKKQIKIKVDKIGSVIHMPKDKSILDFNVI